MSKKAAKVIDEACSCYGINCDTFLTLAATLTDYCHVSKAQASSAMAKLIVRTLKSALSRCDKDKSSLVVSIYDRLIKLHAHRSELDALKSVFQDLVSFLRGSTNPPKRDIVKIATFLWNCGVQLELHQNFEGSQLKSGAVNLVTEFAPNYYYLFNGKGT